MGYYNVVRNDVTLTHHESLSRGADDSTEKAAPPASGTEFAL